LFSLCQAAAAAVKHLGKHRRRGAGKGTSARGHNKRDQDDDEEQPAGAGAVTRWSDGLWPAAEIQG